MDQLSSTAPSQVPRPPALPTCLFRIVPFAAPCVGMSVPAGLTNVSEDFKACVDFPPKASTYVHALLQPVHGAV